MATLLLTALGTAIGGPVGGAIGAFLGRQADQLILGSGSRRGPQLRELTVSTSSYGQPIPRHFGRMRTSGAIIWSTDLVESQMREGGRKGQPSIVRYSYSVSFAVALSSTPIDRLGRIWADGKLLRGAQGDLKVGGRLRVYRGFGDDPIDPLIAAGKGDSAPAFRDCAHVVMEDLQLAEFGNRIPALSFEIFAHGGDAQVALDRLVPDDMSTASLHHLDPVRGFADEGGPLADTLAAIDRVIPLNVTLNDGGLRVERRILSSNAVLTLPEQLAPDQEERDGSRPKQRDQSRDREPLALRYYDEERDYQPGVQRALGSRPAGREVMIVLPAALTAPGAKSLANEIGHRERWQRERITWRIGELDPQIRPGKVVRLPDTPGLWWIKGCEWLDRGVEIVLERLAPTLAGSPEAHAGDLLPPADLPLPETELAAIEVVPDGSSSPSAALLFAAVSARNSAWRGASLYRIEGDALIPIGAAGRERAVMGALVTPLAPSSSILFEPSATFEIELVADDLELRETDLSGIAAGDNRMLVGGEVLQFASAKSLGNRRWRLSGLLRGRGGTEFEAHAGHPQGTIAVLLDDRLTPLTVGELQSSAATRFAAIGTADSTAVVAPLTNPGLSRRPPMPVHPEHFVLADQTREFRWTRRARGQWRWEDGVDLPLVEESESYLVGYGPVAAPFVAWVRPEARFRLTLAEGNALTSAYGSTQLWVKQVGTFSQSRALLLAATI